MSLPYLKRLLLLFFFYKQIKIIVQAIIKSQLTPETYQKSTQNTYKVSWAPESGEIEMQ